MVMVHPKHKKLIKRGLYIGAVIVVLFWVAFGVVWFWNTNYNKALANNAAVLTEVVSKVDNLEDISTIQPSQTSGRLPGVASSYKAAAESASADSLASFNIFSTGRHAGNREVKTLNNEAILALDDTIYRLQVATDGLLVTQKFIEYNPVVDLALYKSGEVPDASERLARTQEGIKGVIKAIESSKLPYRKDILDIVKPLEAKSVQVTPQTVDTWANEVLEAQKKVLIVIRTDYEDRIGGVTQKLVEIAEKYLDRR